MIESILPNGFFGGIPVQPSRCLIPVGDDAVEPPTNDRVFGAFDNRSQSGCSFLTLHATNCFLYFIVQFSNLRLGQLTLVTSRMAHMTNVPSSAVSGLGAARWHTHTHTPPPPPPPP